MAENCTVDQCRTVAKKRGLCNRHYLRAWKYGDPSAIKVVRAEGTLRERFEARLIKNPNGCWGWRGSHSSFGYGEIRFNRELLLAHRLSYEFYIREIPPGLVVCHKCDNPPCCNPDHLFLGTQKDNLADMRRKNRWRATVYKGEQNRSAKLTTQQVAEIKRRFSAGACTKANLAREFAVSATAIYKIIKGETRRDG